MPLLDGPLPSPLRTIHIMGICGTAMGSLAAMLVDAGYQVTGSDAGVYPPMSDVLAGLGIQVMEGFEASNLDHRPDLVVVGNVVRAVYGEAQALLDSDLTYCSFPQLLGAMFLEDTRSLVLAGTHGKTTTTAIATWLLESAGRSPGYLVGGVAANFDRTARSCGAAEGVPRHFVIEGDEYDTAFFDKQPKFVHYRPRTALLTSVEFDHADIYRDLDHVKSAFRRFVGLIPEDDGCLVAFWDDENVREVCAEARCELRRYGPGCAWDGRVVKVDPSAGTMRFEVSHQGRSYGIFESCMVGEHNLWNQVGVVAALDREGVDPAEMAKGFASFRGIKRRQELRGVVGDVAVLDDFAHHPTAVELTLQAIKLRFAGRRLWGVFEPRSNTSRRAFFQERYADAFGAADLVIIADPGRKDALPREELFHPAQLVSDLLGRGIEALHIPTPEEIAAVVAANVMPGDVVAVMSNGSFGGLHDKLLAALEERFGGGGASRTPAGLRSPPDSGYQGA
jgi:UDP-N-acetylmuramate: L-alanyl-gamma-D-glutamyl-meso-diaminopimelate ligase